MEMGENNGNEIFTKKMANVVRLVVLSLTHDSHHMRVYCVTVRVVKWNSRINMSRKGDGFREDGGESSEHEAGTYTSM